MVDKKVARLHPHPLDDYFSEMMALPYLTRRRIMRFQIAESPRRFQYKYVALTPIDPQKRAKGFTGRSLDRLRDIVVGSRLFLCPPVRFNDPFDTAAHMVALGTPDERRAKFEGWLTSNGVYDLGRRAEAMKILMSKASEDLSSMFGPALEKIRETTGVVCFAGDPRSTLLWSHYAAEHTGVCLQLETARDFPVLSRAVRVDYEAEYPTINWFVGYEDGIKKMLLGKHPSWKYEDETRIIVDGEAGTYLPFRPEALRAIVLGVRADRSLIQAIATLLPERKDAGYPSVRLYKAHLHGRKYRLVIKALKLDAPISGLR